MENVIECENLTKKYKGVVALNSVSLHVPDKGGVVGLLGTNGSGKTTLIKLLTGLLTPTEGTIRVAGLPVGTLTKSLVAYLPDSKFLCDAFTVKEEVQYYKDFFDDFDEERAKKLLSDLGIPLKSRVKTLSKGTKEKLGLLLTLSRNAKLYIFDEPIAGVDPAAREYIIHTVLQNKKEDATVLLCTHLISDIEPILDYAIFLQNGNVVLEGKKDDICEKEGKTLDALFREIFKW